MKHSKKLKWVRMPGKNVITPESKKYYGKLIIYYDYYITSNVIAYNGKLVGTAKGQAAAMTMAERAIKKKSKPNARRRNGGAKGGFLGYDWNVYLVTPSAFERENRVGKWAYEIYQDGYEIDIYFGDGVENTKDEAIATAKQLIRGEAG